MSDMPEAYYEVTRKARINHKCVECRQQISAGDSYVFASGIWSGQPAGYKLCKKCHKAITNWKTFDPECLADEGPGIGEMGEWLNGFMCQSYHGLEAAKDMAECLCVPVDHICLILGIQTAQSLEAK